LNKIEKEENLLSATLDLLNRVEMKKDMAIWVWPQMKKRRMYAPGCVNVKKLSLNKKPAMMKTADARMCRA